ncbi:ATPase domain-containing protein, partial [[Eubacterium] cellulosolvens]
WNPEEIGSSKLKTSFEGDEKHEGTEIITHFLVESKIKQQQTSTDSNLSFLMGVLSTTVGIILIIPLAIWFRKHDLSSMPIFRSFNNRNGISKSAKLFTQETIQTISTGYNTLDRLLNGGLKRNYIVALTTPSCDETDLLIHRFLDNSLKSQNSTLYVTTKINGERELLENYPENFFYMICNPQMDEDSQIIKNVYRVGGVDNLTEINLKTANVLQKMKETKKEKVACIEIISDILLQHGLVTTRKWLIDFIARMRSNNMTTIMILNSQMHSKEDLESILGLFDGQIDVWEQGLRETARKQLKVKRMYRHVYDDQSIPLDKSELY